MTDGRRVAVVVGSGAGIGREIALRLAARGDAVVLTGRSVPEMERVAARVTGDGGAAAVVPLDLRDPASVAAAARRAGAEFGRVDTLVCNSGVAGPTAPLHEVDPADWADTLAVNLTGVFLCAREFLPAMYAAGSGSVVVVGSMTGKRPLPARTPYAASKAALIGLVRTLAAEAGPHGVRVNLVSPGGVEGPRLDRVVAAQAAARGLAESAVRASFAAESPLGRLVTAGDVAATVAFLSSPEAGGLTGQDLNVTAGQVMY
ncbi:SDR family NAD(P)-dependent oxidoreductase [Pseudonocardia spirodelae]|uniref:SDR family NAD(P)-dependent oxidoreductase n=1 Tax=Pseudonocardia spirodelae TaxID=3133431 RepID=A0ABU8T7Y7_9PSEU